MAEKNKIKMTQDTVNTRASIIEETGSLPKGRIEIDYNYLEVPQTDQNILARTEDSLSSEQIHKNIWEKSLHAYIKKMKLFNDKDKEKYGDIRIIDTDTSNGNRTMETYFPQCEFIECFDSKAIYEDIDHDGSARNDLWGSHKDEFVNVHPEKFATMMAQSVVRYGQRYHSLNNNIVADVEESHYRDNLCARIIGRNIGYKNHDSSTKFFIFESCIISRTIPYNVEYVLGRSFSSIIIEDFINGMSNVDFSYDQRVTFITQGILENASIHTNLFEEIFKNKPHDFAMPFQRVGDRVIFMDPYIRCSIRRVPADPVAIMDFYRINKDSIFGNKSDNPEPTIDPVTNRPGQRLSQVRECVITKARLSRRYGDKAKTKEKMIEYLCSRYKIPSIHTESILKTMTGKPFPATPSKLDVDHSHLKVLLHKSTKHK